MRAAAEPGPAAAGPEASPREPGRASARGGPGAGCHRHQGTPGGLDSFLCFQDMLVLSILVGNDRDLSMIVLATVFSDHNCYFCFV